MVRVVRLERTVSWSQTRRDTNFAIPGYSISAMIPRRVIKIKIFLSVVIYVVKAAFVPFSATGGNPANAGVARLCGVSPHPIPDTATALPNHVRYQLRYTRLWNCFICGLSCGLSRFLTNGFAEIVPASGGVPAVCEVGLFPSWMGGIRSQITRAANYATFGHRYFSRPGAFFPTYVRQYTLRSAALALWHHLLLDRGQHDGFILYLSILPVSPPKSSLFASVRYVGKAVRRLWGLRTA